VVATGSVTETVVFFSEHFELRWTQEQLDFVDIPLNTDIPLYVDPYAFKIGLDLWSIECNNLVVDYFQNVVDSIRAADHDRVRFLLSNLHEPNSTHLGLSRGRPRGRGVGGDQAIDVYKKLKESRAAKSGVLRDLSDCELMIPGIGHDKISDITINIIRQKLVGFTELQYRLHRIPSRLVQAGPSWCPELASWRNGYGRLPIYLGRPVVLVPKQSVRYRPAADHQEYYHKFVLEYLQQENLNSNSSLVQVLRSGKRKVTKRSLEELFPCDKEFLFEFSQRHPEVLQHYKESLPFKADPIGDDVINQMYLKVFGRTPGSTTVTNVTIVSGDQVMEKNVVHGDNIGGVVGSGLVNARDITIYKNHVERSQSLDDTCKWALAEARQVLEGVQLSVADKHDVADSLGKLTEELEKPAKEKGLINRYYLRIKEVAPTVASVLGSIKIVSEVVNNMLP